MGARAFLDAVLDPGTFTCWDTGPVSIGGATPHTPRNSPVSCGGATPHTPRNSPVDVRPGPGYAAELAEARARTGLDESVTTGAGRIRGRRVAVVVSEFGFLGGSIGVASARRVTAAVERATSLRLPLLAAPASGGTRMQEGTPAFLHMIGITGAVSAHKAAGLPFLTYLRHPTTGGVLASWGSLGHLTFAEPGALVGFLGPRVHRALAGEALPADVQRAENLHVHDLVDQVVPVSSLAATLDRTLGMLAPARGRDLSSGHFRETGAPAAPRSGWEAVLVTRRPGRPGARFLLDSAASDALELGGDGAGLILALTRFGRTPCVLLAQERTGGPFGVAALRRARRGIRLAADLGLPLVTVIDTAGAELSREAEEGGLSREIAHCLAELLASPSPTVSVLFGAGTGGAALALLPADHVIAANHGWLAPLPPEGAAVVVHRDAGRAADLADAQRIDAVTLAEAGVVDTLVPDAAAVTDPADFCHRIRQALETALGDVTAVEATGRRNRRLRRYATLGRSVT
ncbi:acetyl-CoA carboxyl transferase [Actinomadura graeca]|uniref:Acetyl-coenzyme A carboxylase carboxyl transferase subunits beta/alpha n=1 Tax=Actinomadura graeca TaxID=2750812 RepID=A0ABX8R6M2_9ACTN|nr:carboxyl transferase domain-containing protein [Actinomadura graeca]QXJ26730.1 acetyl-CoA carboxyl transferase [Actinomadura graeca]